MDVVYILAIDVCRCNVTWSHGVVDITNTPLVFVRDERGCHNKWPALVVGDYSRNIGFYTGHHRLGFIEDFQGPYHSLFAAKNCLTIEPTARGIHWAWAWDDETWLQNLEWACFLYLN